MHVVKTLEAAAWIPTQLHAFAQDVGSVIPDAFAAYARVFHPPYRLASDGKQTPVRWRDIAAANERSIEAEMQRLGISSDPTERTPTGVSLWDQQPAVGSIPLEIATRLAAILATHTQTPKSCWFAVWEGWGDLRVRPRDGPVFAIPARNLFLLHGALDDVLTTLSEVEWSYRSPNIWWPDDRAWCVATEIDFSWTYVGGSPACVQQVLNDPELEALATHPNQGNAMEKDPDHD